MVSTIVFVLSLGIVTILSFLIGLYFGFIMDKNDKGEIRRFYNERDDGEKEIARLKREVQKLKDKLKSQK